MQEELKRKEENLKISEEDLKLSLERNKRTHKAVQGNLTSMEKP